MGFRTGQILKVWQIRNDDKGVSIQVSASSKDKNTEEYRTTFSSWVPLYGDAKDNVNLIKEGGYIKVWECDVRNAVDKTRMYTDSNGKQKPTMYWNCSITAFTPFEFKPSANKVNKATAKATTAPKTEDVLGGDEDDLPF